MTREISLPLLACFGLTATVPAQEPPDALHDCLNELGPADYSQYAKVVASYVEGPPGGSPGLYAIPLTFHVVRRDDGTGGIPAAQLQQAIIDANAAFAPMYMSFCQFGETRYIDSDAFYDSIDTYEEFEALKSTDRVPHTINVYFTHDIEKPGDPEFYLCGFSAYPWSSAEQAIVMRNACTGVPGDAATFPHELAHFFAVIHTHDEWNGLAECPDGSNCNAGGDLLCDTAADPKLGSDSVDAACQYVGTAGVPCGSDPYDPPIENFMSYSPKPCRDLFSLQQQQIITGTLLNERADLLELSCDWADDCGAGAGSCYAPRDGTPGCDDCTCMAAVCAEDPWCCNHFWDQPCATLAIVLCSDCGQAAAGSCEEPDDTPACDDEACCWTVCNLKPHCCETEWDAECVEIAGLIAEIMGSCQAVWFPASATVPPMAAAGAATIDPDHDGSLVVGNLDASGDDGLVAVGGAVSGYCYETQSPPGGWPIGTAVELVATGRAGGFDDVELGWSRVTAGVEPGGGPRAEIEVSYAPLKTPLMIVQIHDGDRLVLELSSMTFAGDLVATAPVMPGDGCARLHPPDPARPGFSWEWEEPVLIEVITEVGSSAVGTRLTAIAQDPPVQVEAIETLALLASGLPELVIAGAALEPLTCLGDVNADAVVDVLDLVAVLLAWGPNPLHPADVDHDADVGTQDLVIVILRWGPCDG